MSDDLMPYENIAGNAYFSLFSDRPRKRNEFDGKMKNRRSNEGNTLVHDLVKRILIINMAKTTFRIELCFERHRWLWLNPTATTGLFSFHGNIR